MILNMLSRSSFPEILQSPINCGVIAMLGGFIIVPLVSLVTKKPNSDMLEDIFSCYNETVTVYKKSSLSDN